MELIFKDSMGNRRVIASPENMDDVYKEINKFCDERNFKIYYIRTWTMDDVTHFDVGSHTEHFELKN